jgi:hypothetical protein
MISVLAQSLADHHEITDEQLDAVHAYLTEKIARQHRDSCAVSLIAYRTIRIVERTVVIRSSARPFVSLLLKSHVSAI